MKEHGEIPCESGSLAGYLYSANCNYATEWIHVDNHHAHQRSALPFTKATTGSMHFNP